VPITARILRKDGEPTTVAEGEEVWQMRNVSALGG
jgi:hypothetical protein